MASVSIIATTYNQPRDLALYLRTLEKQSFDDFEILIADDGSRVETAEVIRAFQAGPLGSRLKHVWHEDVGYRKCRIVNRATLQASADWLIYTDSDLILHPQFVEDHLKMKAKRRVFMGRRVNLGQRVSNWIRSNPLSLFKPPFYWNVLRSSAFEDTEHWKRTFRVGSPSLRKSLGMLRVPDLLGSNFSICRELMFELNGFDEGLEHYWGEDGDLFIRARNAGAELLGSKCYAVQFHLWHPQRAPQPGAEASYQKRVKSDFQSTRCAQGLAGSEGLS